uniref:SulP family inorganic anion transporter n=1 Tax=Roseivirga sp. TaxID=1964215 RepID=UPI0040471348
MIKKTLPIFNWLPNYQKEHFNGDLFAGLAVGVMLIPQGMAYAMIAGLPPVYGLYTAIFPQLIYAIFGTSRQLAIGPVAMDSLLVAAGISLLAAEGTQAYLTFTILLAFFVGLFQFVLGVARMGFITNLLSKPVISGFTAAVAFIIAITQLKDLIGVTLVKSNKTYEVVISAFDNLGKTHLLTLLIGVAGILLIYALKRWNNKIPGSFIALILGIAAVYGLGLHHQGVKIVAEIPSGLPQLIWPDFSLDAFRQLAPLAGTLALISFIEAYSIGKAMESKERTYKIIPNQELIALGLSNIVGALFQAFPATAGFSRTAVNYNSGAKTPLAAIFSASVIVLTLLFLTPFFYYLPNAILASIIMIAVVNLIEFNYIKYLWKTNKVEFALLMVTFSVTFTFGMVEGIVTGVALSILLLIYRAANPHIAVLGRIKGYTEYRNLKRFDDLESWSHLLIIRIDAPFVFVNIQTIKDRILSEALKREGKLKRVIIDAGPVSYIDATGIDGIRELIEILRTKEIELLFSEVIGPVRDLFYRNNLFSEKATETFFLNTDQAVNYCLSEEHKNNHASFAVQSSKGM